ncbi:hypothetical protein F4808DRAFT_421563 [Astrocystis sublimbata]|nr:hypothetical protein F4808DRAFT_421563 [Astrocystis sublimbata]
MDDATIWLTLKIYEDGPYDGVLAFSEGAEIVSTFFMFEQYFRGLDSPPFNFAVFVNGSLSLGALKAWGVSVPIAASEIVRETKSRRAQHGNRFSRAGVVAARRALYDSDNCFGLNLNHIPRELKIRIPTGHLWIENDPGVPTFTHLAAMCDPYLREIFSFEGVASENYAWVSYHEAELANCVVECMRKGAFPGQSQAR